MFTNNLIRLTKEVIGVEGNERYQCNFNDTFHCPIHNGLTDNCMNCKVFHCILERLCVLENEICRSDSTSES